MELFTVDSDNVIGGYFVSGRVTYGFAIEHLAPLISRLDIQRDPLNIRFYSRLELDIEKGCIMPPITVALIGDHLTPNLTSEEVKNLITNNIDEAFILDGIQRLNTLLRVEQKNVLDHDRSMYVNFIIAGSRDKLLYRMITLNNGQKPMSARHQIDVLSDAFFDFDNIDLQLITEKKNGRVRAPSEFKKSDFVRGYIAYLSNSVNIDNQKIIEEKMDELIAAKIIESDIAERQIDFSDVVGLIHKFSESEKLREWIRGQNNFVGFCVGIRGSGLALQGAALEEIEQAVNQFELAFKSINVSKVNLGKVRRETVAKFIEQYQSLKELDEYALLDQITEWI